MLESRMKVAAIPEPTYDTLKNAWTQLELAYWRLGGQKGERPKPRPENVKGERVHGARGQRGYRVVTRAASRHLSGDRRDAGQPRNLAVRSQARRSGPAEIRRHGHVRRRRIRAPNALCVLRGKPCSPLNC
jgi:hypothetical protein